MAKIKPKEKEAETDTEEKLAVEGEAGAQGAPPAKKSKKKMIIIIVLAIVLLGGGGAGAYFSGLLGKHEPKADENTMIGPDGKIIAKAVYYTLPEFLINLNTGSKQVSFLKTTVILEVPKQTDIPVIEANLPRLVDAFNTYLRELRSSDLSGSAGIQRLREELLLRANKAVSPVKINDVLFKEIIVQ